MKVCFNVLKICYDVSMNKTNSFWPDTPLLSAPFDKKCLFFIIYSCQFKFLSTFFNLMGGTLETKRTLNDYLICWKELCAGVWSVKWTGPWSYLDKWQLCTCRWGTFFYCHYWESANQIKHSQSFGYILGRYHTQYTNMIISEEDVKYFFTIIHL